MLPDRSSQVIASLYIQALREGQSCWFRVASNSMTPLLHQGDTVFIQPARIEATAIGAIAAFETSEGIVIHRIVRYEQTGNMCRLLQMSDVALQPGWLEEQAVVGRVTRARRGNKELDLCHPIAQWSGRVTARLR